MGTDDNTKQASERRVGLTRESLQRTSSFLMIFKNEWLYKRSYVNISNIQSSNFSETVLDES